MKKKIIKTDVKLLIIFFFFLIIILLFIVIYKFKGGIYSFEMEDKCGKFMNLMQHTIETKSICKTRCISQCEAKDYKFKKVMFEQETLSCNKCVCYCRR